MSDINRVVLVGRITKDPELRYTQSETAVTSFSIANNKTWSKNGEKQEQTSFFNCTAWGKVAEIIAEHCKKGARIGVEGRLNQSTWQDNDGNKKSKIDVTVENFQFLDGKRDQEHSGNGNNEQAPSFNDIPAENPFSDDDIPF